MENSQPKESMELAPLTTSIHLELVNLLSNAVTEFARIYKLTLTTHFKTADDKIVLDISMGGANEDEAAND